LAIYNNNKQLNKNDNDNNNTNKSTSHDWWLILRQAPALPLHFTHPVDEEAASLAIPGKHTTTTKCSTAEEAAAPQEAVSLARREKHTTTTRHKTAEEAAAAEETAPLARNSSTCKSTQLHYTYIYKGMCFSCPTPLSFMLICSSLWHRMIREETNANLIAIGETAKKQQCICLPPYLMLHLKPLQSSMTLDLEVNRIATSLEATSVSGWYGRIDEDRMPVRSFQVSMIIGPPVVENEDDEDASSGPSAEW
jgi:hypothetical protein